LADNIRVAFIFKPDYPFLTGDHFDNTTFYFFMKALKRNSKLNVTYFPSKTNFDVSQLKNNFDVILLSDNLNEGSPDELIGIREKKIPVISRVGDFHDAKRKGKIPFHKKYKIDYYFNFMHENYFYKFYPRDFNYRTIVFGVEPELYREDIPFNNRKKDKILNSGAMGNPKLKSRIINQIINPKKSGWYFYRLRTKCNSLNYVDYYGMKGKNYINTNYSELLSKYQASIAATTYYPTIKYWESTASGCLTFMEITEKNNGSYLGFKDNETAIFINEENYQSRFQEFLNDSDNPKWKKIAEAGKNYSLKKFSNDVAIDSLVKLMEEII
jgi:hypothetical protein